MTPREADCRMHVKKCLRSAGTNRYFDLQPHEVLDTASYAQRLAVLPLDTLGPLLVALRDTDESQVFVRGMLAEFDDPAHYPTELLDDLVAAYPALERYYETTRYDPATNAVALIVTPAGVQDVRFLSRDHAGMVWVVRSTPGKEKTKK